MDNFYDVLDDFFTEGRGIQRNLNYDTFKLDIEEKEDEYVLEAELPGVDKEQIKLELEDERLTIAVSREENKDIEEKNFIHKERRISSMQRCVYLENIDDQAIKAKLDNGILTINVQKKEKISDIKAIEIE